MADVITEQVAFKPKLSKSESKYDTTTSAARAIIDAESKRRLEKTARLREARMAVEAQTVAAVPAKKRRAPAKAVKAVKTVKAARPAKAAKTA
ncbi:hypothetical protein IGS74_07395 [Aureimonas sp. OT7]|uniref:hypothetical protein n=1 Tax=Aureimonas TaxID=414371 RepID=UPI00057F40CB|nr:MULTISPECIES: hypothetical protein [Aureimonas]QOG08000.1 hypothetical protein IGS74_07395 [Aureimonas sp. OT7]